VDLLTKHRCLSHCPSNQLDEDESIVLQAFLPRMNGHGIENWVIRVVTTESTEGGDQFGATPIDRVTKSGIHHKNQQNSLLIARLRLNLYALSASNNR
jgi:hypothetical protein